jgi:hypothetical protein
VQKAGYLKLTPELSKQAYDSKAEPMWKTLLAYARRNAIDRELLKPLTVSDAWEISEKQPCRMSTRDRGDKWSAIINKRR